MSTRITDYGKTEETVAPKSFPVIGIVGTMPLQLGWASPVISQSDDPDAPFAILHQRPLKWHPRAQFEAFEQEGSLTSLPQLEVKIDVPVIDEESFWIVYAKKTLLAQRLCGYAIGEEMISKSSVVLYSPPEYGTVAVVVFDNARLAEFRRAVSDELTVSLEQELARVYRGHIQSSTTNEELLELLLIGIDVEEHPENGANLIAMASSVIMKSDKRIQLATWLHAVCIKFRLSDRLEDWVDRVKSIEASWSVGSEAIERRELKFDSGLVESSGDGGWPTMAAYNYNVASWFLDPLGSAQLEDANRFEFLKVGQHSEGVVSRVEDVGAFVDLGKKVEGLVDISELSWKTIYDPREVVNDSDKIRVRVTKIDREQGIVHLSYRAAQDDLWARAERQITPDTICSGTVSRIMAFCVYVKLESGVEGILIWPEVPRRWIESVNAFFRVGQKFQVKVLSIDSQIRQIRLKLVNVQKMDEPKDKNHQTKADVDESLLKVSITNPTKAPSRRKSRKS